MFRIILIGAILALAPLRSIAVEPEVRAELERLANNPGANLSALAGSLQDALFQAIETSCSEQREATPERCFASRLMSTLDRDGILAAHCGALSNGRQIPTCIISGAEVLPIVVALGGDPAKDVDWMDPTASLIVLQSRLESAAERRCALIRSTISKECVIREQAALLEFPAAIGQRCAKEIGFNKQGCIRAVQTLAVYLEGIRKITDPSKPL